MKTRGKRRYVTLLLWLLIIKRVKTDGKLDIRFIKYTSGGRKLNGDCCDDDIVIWCLDKCDPKFSLCIYGSDGGNPCSLYQSTTGYMNNHNIIDFGSSIQGKANPFIIPAPKAVPSSIKILVQVYDYDATDSQDHMDTLSRKINISFAATEQTAMYTPYTLSRRTQLNIAVRAYCDPDWYGSTCEKYCKATSNHSHYMCHLQTGAKICIEGWKGDNCDQDIDECKEIDNTCQNGGSCRNTTGSFECICIEGIKGRRCENIINQCAVAPCLNGGTCGGNETAFNCSCSVEWTGETCAEKVNFCDSAPCNRGNCTPDIMTATGFKCNCDFGWVGERCSLHVDIVNITLLGEIDHTNIGYLADGLNRLITELGEIPGKVDIKFMTHSHTENNFTTTYVQIYSAVENGSFIESPLLDEIFESNPDEVINEYLPLPLYPPREEEKTTLKSPHDSWDTHQYMSAILPSVGLVLMSVLLLVAFCIWRRRSERSEGDTDEDQIGLFVINVPCNRNLNRADSVTSFRQDASFCPEGDTSLDFDEAQEVTLDTVCDEISNTQPTTEDVTLDPLSIQGSNVSDNARLSDVATTGTRRHVTSLDPEGLPSVIVSPDDHARLGDFGTSDTHDHVTSYTPLGVLPCTSGGGLPQTNSYDPLNRCEEEDAECTVVDDNTVEDISEENPYVDLVVLKI